MSRARTEVREAPHRVAVGYDHFGDGDLLAGGADERGLSNSRCSLLERLGNRARPDLGRGPCRMRGRQVQVADRAAWLQSDHAIPGRVDEGEASRRSVLPMKSGASSMIRTSSFSRFEAHAVGDIDTGRIRCVMRPFSSRSGTSRSRSVMSSPPFTGPARRSAPSRPARRARPQPELLLHLGEYDHQ